MGNSIGVCIEGNSIGVLEQYWTTLGKGPPAHCGVNFRPFQAAERMGSPNILAIQMLCVQIQAAIDCE